MREILFRGKRADTGEWIEGYFGQSIDSFIIQDYGLVAGRFEVFKVIPETVGQFTGLTDKNNKKIFEGDIITFCYSNYEVGFSSASFGYLCGGYNGEGYSYIIYFDDYENGLEIDDETKHIKNIEVIGNIHDNPNLLT